MKNCTRINGFAREWIVPKNKHNNGYKHRKRLRPMTLIIGAKFKEGVVLVSDRMVTGGVGKPSWEKKLIKCPIDIPIVFGAAGYRNKFKQFNRKIIEKVEESLRIIELNNIGYLKRRGFKYSREEIDGKVEKFSEVEIKTPVPKKEKKGGDSIVAPFRYTDEKFIDDCSSLVRGICKDEISLDVLLIRFAKEPFIHHINFLGDEEEVDYYAIGSGSEHAYKFLGDFWREDMDINEILALAFFCIYYVQDLGFNLGVGVEEGNLPDHKIILKDGRLGELEGINEVELISKIRGEIEKFESLIKSLPFKKKE